MFWIDEGVFKVDNVCLKITLVVVNVFVIYLGYGSSFAKMR